MISADELTEARLRAGYTSQAALAKALGVSQRTVTTWEHEGVPIRAEAKVRRLLWPEPPPPSENGRDAVEDAILVDPGLSAADKQYLLALLRAMRTRRS